MPDPANRGGDRKDLHLHPEAVKLIQALAPENPNTIVVLIGGSAILMEEWTNKLNSILMAWYSGMEGGTALARILFGDVNLSGKLTVTFSMVPSQLPPFTPPYTGTVDYGYYHGYTLAKKKAYQPSFPFGFGLSYTTFQYSNLNLDTTEIAPDGELPVSVEVKNTGARSGEEVVQLYLGFSNAKVDRPVKFLRGFNKILLSPGEKQTVTFTLARPRPCLLRSRICSLARRAGRSPGSTRRLLTPVRLAPRHLPNHRFAIPEHAAEPNRTPHRRNYLRPAVSVSAELVLLRENSIH